ncbi:glycosyltransferase [Edaphobacter aggregans]|uniref:glycosyltransferase n=1 Tax=Edaphobacter aggregans TaxID=570835 RepID=UPI00068CD73F|nr:glycosyltransferase [Edaphobacter aggregans]
MQRLRLVVPVFNDWASFNILIRELDRVAADLPVRMAVSVVNDGSTHSPEADLDDLSTLKNLEAVEIIHLYSNVGHQRAIAIGLCVAAEDDNFDAALVMDADGEDSPDVIGQLLETVGNGKDFCVVARRRRRSENLTFKLSYLIYKFAFRMLTGKQIAFGNFSLFSRSCVKRLVRVSDLWNNLPAAVLRSRLPIRALPVDRAHRYAGKSKMNMTSLVVHGFSGISVYAETIFVRLLFVTLALVSLSTVSIAVVLTLRLFFPLHATPGWATTVSFGMIIILVQVLSITLSSILMLLNSRVQRLIVPLADYKCFIDYRQQLLNDVQDSETSRPALNERLA